MGIRMSLDPLVIVDEGLPGYRDATIGGKPGRAGRQGERSCPREAPRVLTGGLRVRRARWEKSVGPSRVPMRKDGAVAPGQAQDGEVVHIQMTSRLKINGSSGVPRMWSHRLRLLQVTCAAGDYPFAIPPPMGS